MAVLGRCGMAVLQRCGALVLFGPGEAGCFGQCTGWMHYRVATVLYR